MATRLGLDEARMIVDVMLAEAQQRDIKFAAAVVDAGGDLIHLSRMNGLRAECAHELQQGVHGNEMADGYEGIENALVRHVTRG